MAEALRSACPVCGPQGSQHPALCCHAPGLEGKAKEHRILGPAEQVNRPGECGGHPGLCLFCAAFLCDGATNAMRHGHGQLFLLLQSPDVHSWGRGWFMLLSRLEMLLGACTPLW